MRRELTIRLDSTIRHAVSLPPQITPAGKCPDSAVWYEIAAGIAPETTERELTGHAVLCGRCAPLLKAAFDCLEVELPPPVPRPFPAALCMAGIAVVAVCLAAWVWPSYELRQTRTLLAQAEATDRPNEFRLSGAPYAPVRFTRSGPQQDQTPPPLLKAAAAVSHASQSPETAILKARIALDSRDPGDHAAPIRDAMKQLGESPQLNNDLGVALATRWATTRNDADLRAAIEAFKKANSLPEARFNQALAEKYLNTNAPCPTTADPDPRWQSDLRLRLNCK